VSGAAVCGEALEAVPGSDHQRGSGHLFDRPKALERHLLLLQIEALSEGLCVLPIQGPDGTPLKPEERGRRGDSNGDTLDHFHLHSHGVEARP